MSESFVNRRTEKLIFVALFFLVLIFLNYEAYFFLKPRSFHFIRQTDSLSFINYYTKTGFNFFNTGNLNLYNGSGKTICEFPLLYYVVALLSKTGIKGYLLLKSLHIIVFFFTAQSIYFFLRKSNTILNSLSITFLLFSSTVFLYYTINYIPNYPALCFTLCGCVSFFNYLEASNRSEINKALLFFLIAGLLKVTFSIYALSCFFYFIILYIKLKRIDYKVLAAFCMLILTLVCWNFYVIYYNKLNSADYYLTQARPIWETSKEGKKEVFGFIFNYWLYKYYFQSTIHLFLITCGLGLIFFRKINRKHFLYCAIALLGISSYFILFFKQFRDHDYYFLEFIPFLFLFFFVTYTAVKIKADSKIYLKYSMSVILVVISFLSINYAKLNLQRRYDQPFEQVSKIAYTLENIEEKIDSVGVSKKAKVFVMPDNTMNGSLFYINRFGYTKGDTSNIKAYLSSSDYILITDSGFQSLLVEKFKLRSCLLNYRGASLYKIH